MLVIRCINCFLTIILSILIMSGETPGAGVKDYAFAVRVKETSTGYLNVRTGPGTAYSIITKIYPGQKFISDLYENGWYRIHLPSGSQASYGWSYGGTTVDNGHLEGSQETDWLQVVDWKGDLNVRTGPGTSYPVITTVSSGQRFACIEESNGWYRFDLANVDGYSYGWSSGNYMGFFPGGARDGYQGQLISVDSTAVMQAGSVSSVRIDILNSGSNSFDSSTILAASNPRFRSSPFYHSSWQSDSRVTGAPAPCLPGQQISFDFVIQAPSAGGRDAYTEYFNLYQDGFAWFSDQGGPGDDNISFVINVGGSASEYPKRELRAVWISTVYNIDWPKQKALQDANFHPDKVFPHADWPVPGKDTSSQQNSLISILDEHQALGINAVFLQIRPACDAFYQSSYEPWSRYLTGVEGQAPSPFWDPLDFAVQACHDRGMELHAWINPYRARAGGTSNHPTHVINTHPEWIVTYGASGKKILNPGLPEVREHVSNVIIDIASRYDVDGIHFDDYFYPYPESGYTFNDSDAYNTYAGGMSLADWRRNNVNTLVQMVHDSVKAINPRIKFGISPFGIWKSGTPQGIYGLSAYDDIYCDALAWLTGNYVDYISPQLYWGYGGSTDYALLMPWWSAQAENSGRHFMPGLAAYRVASGQMTTETLKQQVLDNRLNSSCQGNLYFSSNSITEYTTVKNMIKDELYPFPALVPPMPWLDNVPPLEPASLDAIPSRTGTLLVWSRPEAAADGEYPSRYILYYSVFGEIDIDNPGNILYMTAISDEPELSFNHQAGGAYYYAVTSLDRMGNESQPTLSSPVEDPSGFIASAEGPYSIYLSWVKNPEQDDVMIAFNTSDNFGIPQGVYTPGQTIAQGGTVICTGSGTSFTHDSLTPSTPYYYRIWSLNAIGQYSQGIASSASTYPAELYTLSLYAYPEDGNSLSGAGAYFQGETVFIEAFSDDFSFFKWTGAQEDIILLQDPCQPSASFTMPARDINLKAQFIEDTLQGKSAMSFLSPSCKGTYIWSYDSGQTRAFDSRGSVWQNISGLSSSKMLAGDILNSSSLQIISIFPGYGLWYYNITQNVWTNIMGGSVSCLDIALSWTGDHHRLIASFEGYGLYFRETGGQWHRLTPAHADALVTLNFDRDDQGTDELIFTVPCCSGLFLYDFDLQNFVKLEMLSPSSMISADTDGTGFKELVCVFDSAGIYIGRYSFLPGLAMDRENPFLSKGHYDTLKSYGSIEWTRITSAVPMEGHQPGYADIAGSPGKEIFMAYNGRTYYYSCDTSAWVTFLYAPLDRIISGRFSQGYFDDLIVQASQNKNIYLYLSRTNSWEIIAVSADAGALASY